jgi:hypothetical protein
MLEICEGFLGRMFRVIGPRTFTAARAVNAAEAACRTATVLAPPW